MFKPKSLLLFLACSLSPLFLKGQYTISGFVKAKESKEALINAVVFNPLTFQNVLTNEYGYFSMTTKDKKIKLTASYVGYEDLTRVLQLEKDTVIDFFLTTTMLEEVEVIAKKSGILNNQLGRVSLPVETLAKVPSVVGEPDVLRSLSILPGVSLGREGNSALFVRGGTPDQNLILLDDVPVYNAAHLGGFFSVFNPDALNKIDLIKGGFPARYGGRLSSIIDVRMKEGNQEELRGNFGLGVITSSLMLEGPFKKEKSGFLLAARSSYLGIINLFRKKENYFDYWLYDINAKTNFSTPKGKLFFSFYTGNDYGIETSDTPSSISGNMILERLKVRDKINWGNTTFTSRYFTSLSAKSFLSVLAGYTQYRYSTRFELEQQKYGELDTLVQYEASLQTSTISDFIFKSHIDFIPNEKQQFRLGASFISRLFDVESDTQNEAVINNSSFLERNHEVTGYIEDFIRWNKSFTTNIGLRWNGYLTEGKSFYSLQPRFSSKYQISEHISMQLAYAYMQQNIHLLTNSGFSFPSDIWIPATKNVAPSRSNQFDAGFFIDIKNTFQISLEGFYKRQSHLIAFKNSHADILENVDQWESLIEKNGKGTIRGIELMLRKSTGKWQGLIAYTLSKNERKFENINFGKTYLFDYHRPHDFNISVFRSLNHKWSLSANWIYQTGRRVTFPVGLLPDTGTNSGTTLIFAEKNNGKFPNYHRLDVGFTYKNKKKGERQSQWIFNIYNLYNRRNTSYFYFDSSAVFDEQQNYLYSIRKANSTSLFSIIPSLSYKYKF